MVPTRKRQVRYANWATDKAGLTYLFIRDGTETVDERPYCLAHALTAPPPTIIPGLVERAHRFQSIRSHRRLREDYGPGEY